MGIVLCPDSLTACEKGSGETRIQFWFHAARCGRGQSDCGMVSVVATFELKL